MIQIYADDLLAYDSRLEDYSLIDLTVTTGLNKGGTASITMPQHHPAYNRFISYKTLVTVYKDGSLLFRGRALYPSDDFYNRRTITCEGELCFFQDSVIRPYLYQDGPAAIFADIVNLHNAQVDEFKRFEVGTITVTDPNNYIRLESENAQQTSEVINKLLERVGGYIVFTTNSDGKRFIHWYEELTYRSGQVIEFGENLLDFARDGADTDIATVVIPYGAKDETTGQRVDITSVNDGLDFIQDYDAVALRGVIAKTVTWDDVTMPQNLLAKAQQYLSGSKMAITTLELTAVDLSDMDKSIDTFQVGDHIQVRSLPHGVNESFQLTERTYDLLDPSKGKVTLGKQVATLTGSDAAGDRQSMSEMQRVEQSIKSNFTIANAAAIEELRETLTSLIAQTSESIMLEVSEEYTTNGDLTGKIETVMTQLSDSFEFQFTQLQAVVDENDMEARAQFDTMSKYIRFEDGDIVLGEAGNELVLRIENDRISFLDDGAEVAYLSNKRLYVTDGHFLQSLRIGSFAWVPRANGNLSLMKVVE